MLNNFELILLSMIVSGLLFLILAVYKKYSKLWWTIGGALLSLPIAMLIPALQNFFLKSFSIPNTAIYIVLYIICYSAFWLFTEKSYISEAEKVKKEKLDNAIFEGFLAMREKKLEDAYYHFKQGQSVDPNNRVISMMLDSLDSGRLGKLKHNPILEKWYYVKSLFRKNNSEK